jgi:release factor glutamine methyltransferase
VTGAGTAPAPESVEFGGLTICFDARVLRPRAWTAHQSRWAAEILAGLLDGPVLELCAGAGQIGLAAVRGSRRGLVCVDVDPVASAFVEANARAAGMGDRVDVRTAPLVEAAHEDETFALILADPPWVRRADVGSYPEDPHLAIDGGDDGLTVARECVAVIGRHLRATGAALLQLGTRDQAGLLEPEIASAGLRQVEVRSYDRGALVRLDPIG